METSLYSTTRLTLELREIVDNGVDIWNFDYPSYYKGDEKTAFEQKVIDHYYTRQIGFETVGRFIQKFRTRIKEIMPRYIRYYKTVEIMDNLEDPFGNLDVTETFREDSSGTNKGSSDLEHKFANTPQGQIENIEHFMTEGSKDANSSEGEYQSSVERTFTRKGNHGVNTYAHDMIEFRESIIDVDMMIIHDLSDLFLAIY